MRNMKKFAVSYIDWFDYNLTTLIIEASDWFEAMLKHPKIATFTEPNEDTYWKNDSVEANQKRAFDCDCMINVVEII
jgi:hypothetical protein